MTVEGDVSATQTPAQGAPWHLTGREIDARWDALVAQREALRQLLQEAQPQVEWAAHQLGYSGRNEAMAVLIRIDAALERTPDETIVPVSDRVDTVASALERT